ncbi:hypothetical protein [Rickettsia endosymbiont of Orchestes rusci]|uniref:hypothetical protein n=1 Tax=Rickettsia endosymbiont of Orchestes rusci TaxID=3066250 RepID=UPI00313E2906
MVLEKSSMSFPRRRESRLFFVMLNLFQHLLHKILKQVQDDYFFLDSRLRGNDI